MAVKLFSILGLVFFSVKIFALDILSHDEMEIYVVEQPHLISSSTSKNIQNSKEVELNQTLMPNDTSPLPSVNTFSNAAVLVNTQDIKPSENLLFNPVEPSVEDILSNAFQSELVRGVFSEQEVNISNIDMSGTKVTIDFHK